MPLTLVKDEAWEEPIEFTPYEFTQWAVNHKGQPIDLDTRPWLWHPYNLPFCPTTTRAGRERLRRRILFVFGRQSEKSTSLGNMLMSSSNLIPYLRSLYVTASNPQMLEFSDERLRAVIDDSPILRDLSGATSKKNKQIQNVTTKRWRNGSKIVLRSVYRSADRVRGIPTDVLAVDELQDIYIDELPVIEETTRASQLQDGDLRIYAGTPKTFDNSIEFYWSRRSTQNEWMIKCSKCNLWNTVEVGNIRPDGLCCIKCDRELDPVHNGQWVRFGAEDSEWEGFRVPQPIVEYVYRPNADMFWRKWETLVQKVVNYPRAKLENEVLARSYDSGTKPVTYQQVRRCALPEKSLMVKPTASFRNAQKWSGTDWGTGDASYTIHSIWYYDIGGRFQLAYAKKYVGREADPEWSVEDIIRTDREFGVTRLGCDWGFGFDTNNKLVKAFGADKVKQYHHTDGQSKLVNYDEDRNVYTTHRSRVMAMAFELIKRGPVSGGAGFVNWEQFETFGADILSIFSEYSKIRRQIVYDHPRGVPDDFFHTMIYALLASMLDHRRPDLITAVS